MKKYIIIKNRNMANTMSMLTGQQPYIYNSNDDATRKVWSFINDEAFQEAFEIVNELIDKNRK